MANYIVVPNEDKNCFELESIVKEMNCTVAEKVLEYQEIEDNVKKYVYTNSHQSL